MTSIGSLSTRVFETRTATGSELFSLLTCPHTTTFTLLSIFSPLEISSIKIWRTIPSYPAKCSLPVAVRVSKTRVLKLPNINSINRGLGIDLGAFTYTLNTVSGQHSKCQNSVTTIKASGTLEHQPTVWPVPNACAQPYHPGSQSHGHLLGLISMAN